METAVVDYLKQKIMCPVTKSLLGHCRPMLLKNQLFLCTERDRACLIQEDLELRQVAQEVGLQIIAFGARY